MNVLLCIALLVFGADPKPADSDIIQALEASTVTRVRMQREAAQWGMKYDAGNGPVIEVVVLQNSEASLFELKVITGGRSSRIATILRHADAWYVDDGFSKRKYRPYEACLPLPNGILFMGFGQLQLIDDNVTENRMRVERIQDNHLVGRLPLDPAQEQNARMAIAKMNELRATLVNTGKDVPKAQEILDNLNDAVTKGRTVIVDRASGQILETGIPPRKTTFSPLVWLGDVKPPALEPVGKWEDHTKPFSPDDLKDLIQISHNPMWRPGQPTGDSDVMLVNLRTQEIRRAPIPFGAALSGCFSPDRSRIYISGLDPASANLGLFSIELASAECQRVGDGVLDRGNWFNSVVSPSGDVLAAVQVGAGEGLKSQIHVIDLKSRESKPVGSPMDLAMLNWHPRGDSLICMVREPGPDNSEVAFICKVTLDGKVTKLCRGRFPEVLPQQQRILFEDDDDEARQFKTCDLDGKDIQVFGNGFKGFGFASASPDGRLIMIKFSKTAGPQPCLIDMKSYEVKPLKLGPGMWSRPKWR
ncbi:MAG: hypothetical protein JWP89_6494 [Schlesneria sp.]|nr:hypothetical protein [Schlesneria sp.]